MDSCLNKCGGCKHGGCRSINNLTSEFSKYKITTDPKEMMTNAQINNAIEEDWKNIKHFLPVTTATWIEYGKGAKYAWVWNINENIDDKEKTRISLPMKDNWYIPDNPFGIPNGEPSNPDDPTALLLYRRHSESFEGPIIRAKYGEKDDEYTRRRVFAFVKQPNLFPGLMLVDCSANVPSVIVQRKELISLDDLNPQTLRKRANQLNETTSELIRRLVVVLDRDAYTNLIKPIVDQINFLNELAEKIESIQTTFRPK